MSTRKLKEIILAEWVPALITGILGGVIIAFLAPALQAKYAEETALKKRKIDLWESIGDNFTNYISFRNRLNEAASAEANAKASGNSIDPDFKIRKESYRIGRDEYLNKLLRDLNFAEYYYDSEVCDSIHEFLSFQQTFKNADVKHQPPAEKIDHWKDKIMTSIRSNLMKVNNKIQ